MKSSGRSPAPKTRAYVELCERRKTYARAIDILSGHISEATGVLVSLEAIRSAADALPPGISARQPSLGQAKALRDRSRIGCLRSFIAFSLESSKVAQTLRLQEAEAQLVIAQARLQAINASIAQMEAA